MRLTAPPRACSRRTPRQPATNVVRQLSSSWGASGSTSSYEQVFMEMAAQGQSVIVASGDGGANVGTVSGYPRDSPNVTTAGGTDLVTSGPAGAWQSETGWVGSGGGWSTESAIPSYQAPVINSSNQGSTQFRNFPDIAMEANTDNYFCSSGGCSGVGGTSLAAPRWAGFVALVNQQGSDRPVGFLNPALYALGRGSAYNTLFHDTTSGNNFNSASPNLFSAVPGYDLVTGWGSPNGQNLINALAPVNSTAPGFSLASSQAAIDVAPGGSGTAPISVSGVNGFNGSVNLSVKVVNAPAGVSASVSPTSVTGSGSALLSVSTTSSSPGGTFLVAVTGTSGVLTQTTYLTLGLPDFTLSTSPLTLYVNQSSSTTQSVIVTPVNGFTGNVALSILNGPPAGIGASFSPSSASTSSTLTLTASATAQVGPSAVTVSGTSGNITRVPQNHSASLYINAATGTGGFGTPVDLSPAYNVSAISSDGTADSSGGLDGGGNAYSANLLTPSRILNGVQFNFGPANNPDAVFGAGQTIALPSGNFTTLQFLATGIGGDQASQTITVTYSDGTTSVLTQSFSDWFIPASHLNESQVVFIRRFGWSRRGLFGEPSG